MATRKRQGATRGKRKSGTTASPLVWALGLLSISLLVALLVLINIKAPEAPMHTPEPATPAAIETRQPVETGRASNPLPIPPEPDFSFYNDLKKQTVIVPTDETTDAHESTGPLLLPSKPATRNSAGSKQAYILQVASFRKPQQADQMKARLALLGIKARIEKVRVSDGVWHRVRLGPFTSLDEANQLRSKLLAQKIKSMMMKVGQ